MNVAAKVAHCGLETGLHMSLYNPAATFSHLLCLHNLRKRLSERDRKKGDGGNDGGRRRERQLMNGGGESGRLEKKDEGKGPRREREGRDGHSTWFQLNTDFIIRLGCGGGGGGGGDGGCGCGSSKTHNFLRSENQILKMTGLISVLSELGSRREGGAGGLSATICQGELETIRAE